MDGFVVEVNFCGGEGGGVGEGGQVDDFGWEAGFELELVKGELGFDCSAEVEDCGSVVELDHCLTAVGGAGAEAHCGWWWWGNGEAGLIRTLVRS